MPSLIRPSYRFVTTYAFSDIWFLKVPRREEKKRWLTCLIESLYRKWLTNFGGVYTETKVIYLIPLERELADNGVTLQRM
nr:hypothetical protein [Candidatus Enterovibrio escacola]